MEASLRQEKQSEKNDYTLEWRDFSIPTEAYFHFCIRIKLTKYDELLYFFERSNVMLNSQIINLRILLAFYYNFVAKKQSNTAARCMKNFIFRTYSVIPVPCLQARTIPWDDQLIL